MSWSLAALFVHENDYEYNHKAMDSCLLFW